jgi:hypothetical protein
MKKMIRFVGVSTLLLLAVQLTGCANLKMGAPVATLENTAALRAAGFVPANVGTFTAGERMLARDKSVSVRAANSLESPIDSSFTQYLRETLKVELASAGLLDANSGTVITGTLIDTELDPAMSSGTGSLTARFVVTRDGKLRFDRELKVSSTWESSFIGAIAIPAAMREYEGLYRKLVTTLMNNAEFRKSMTKD